MSIAIRPPQAKDRADWEALYAAYADFYGESQDDVMRARVWDWLMDDAHEVRGRVAVGDQGVMGLAHVRSFARPLAAGSGLFLDDLFVDPAFRGMGVATALIAEVRQMAETEGHGVVRWITAADNDRAMRVYDRIATRTGWVTYDIPL